MALVSIPIKHIVFPIMSTRIAVACKLVCLLQRAGVP